jgi:predicted phosphodiesterase
MARKWNEEEEHLLRVLVKNNKKISEISQEFEEMHSKNLPGFKTLRSKDSIRKKCDRDNLNTKTLKSYHSPYEDRWNYIKELTKEFKEKSYQDKTGLDLNVSRKILTLSDIHYPFGLDDEIAKALKDHSDADIVVLNGDILDGYIFSTWAKAKRIAALKEYIAAFELVNYCSENFSQVVVVAGNHDIRPSRALAKAGFEKEESQVLRPDLLARITNGEKLNEYGDLVEKLNFDNVHYDRYDSWYTRIGKTIFAHPSGYRGGPGGTAQKLYEYFIKRMGSDDFDSIVVGHTHKIYKGVFCNKLLIEQGAMCDRQPYQHKPDLRFLHAMNGYAIIYQDKHGNTDFNKSNVVYLGSMIPPKKSIL